MPVRNLMRYYLPEKFDLQNEEDVLSLLRDVRSSLININKQFRSTTLGDVLDIVEKGKCIIEHEDAPPIEIDLSNAYSIISKYRHDSEGGCQSCVQIRIFKQREEAFSYCKLYEDEKSKMKSITFRTGHSPRIKEYFEKGCDKKDPLFRPIEEILENY